MAPTQRTQWVDFAKGMAIMAVVLLHIAHPAFDSTTPPLREFLGGAWHVAAFFMLGGFFLKEEKLQNARAFLKGKLKGLYLPLLYFFIPAVCLNSALVDWGWYSTTADYADKLIAPFGVAAVAKRLALTVCLAGREPILGAMWFVCVLFMALVGLAAISKALKSVTSTSEQYDSWKWLVLLALALAASALTNQCGINIPRFNNVFTAMWLIHTGYWLRNRLKCEFSSPHLFAASLLALVYLIFNEREWIALNSNKFSDLATMTLTAACALYIMCYIGRKTENSPLTKLVAYCGRESFYIMALQFAGFKVGVYLLRLSGQEADLAALQPETHGSLATLALYFACGVGLPCLFMKVFRFAKAKLLNLAQKKNGTATQ